MKLYPLNGHVVIEPIEQDNKTEGGIYIPENAVEKPSQGKVIAVGDGVYQDGSLIPPAVKESDTVLFPKYAGAELKLDGKKVLIIRQSEILAIVAPKYK